MDLASVDGFGYDDVTLQSPNPGTIVGRLLSYYGSSTRGFNKVGAIGVKEELITIAAAATSTSADLTLLPANSLILAVVGRVTVAIPTAATFAVTDPTQTGRFATGILVALNTTFVGFLQWNPAIATDALGPRQTAAAGVRIVPNLTPGTAVGRLAVQVIYLVFTPPTS